MSLPSLVTFGAVFGLNLLFGFFSGLLARGRHVTEPIQTILRINDANYGVSIPVVYGVNRLSGNIIYVDDFVATAHTQTQRTGKGSGPKSTYTYYTYSATLIIAICEGEIESISRIWVNNNIEYNPTQYYKGSLTQSVWPYLESNHPDKALRYPGIAYYCRANMDFGTSPQIPTINFEVHGKLKENANGANPANIIDDLITNTVYGAGLSITLDKINYASYCVAEGIYLSPALSSQESLNSLISRWLGITNSAAVVSGDTLILKPLCDTPVGDWTPDLTATAIDETDLLEDPEVERIIDNIDRVSVTYLERENNYNRETVEAWLQTAVVAQGYSTKLSSNSLEEITDKTIARKVAQLILQQGAYPGNKLRITVPWRYIYLEPLDLISFWGRLWRIEEIVEEGDDRLQITAIEVVPGRRELVNYTAQIGSRYAMKGQEDPGNTTLVVAAVVPPEVSGTIYPWVYGAVAGNSDNWGGCEVWVSTDDENYYKRGAISGASICGTLAESLPTYTGDNPDTVNNLVVNLLSDAVMESVSEDDAKSALVLLYVDGEYISYQTATFTSSRKYTLTTLYRGLYGSARSAHSQDAPWCKLDSSCIQFEILPQYSGKKVYVKLPSFNKTYQKVQSLADIDAYEIDLANFSNLITITADYTITSPVINTVFANCEDDDITLTLPSITKTDTREIMIKRLGAVGKTLTIQAQGSSTIDGASSIELTGENETVNLRAIQGNWYRR